VRALLLLGVLVACGFLGLMLFVTDGHFVAQTPDLYVIAQYARAMAEGHPFQYNAGEAPTTGATSVLHTSILALAHALGARGEGLVAFAVLFGTALYLASILLAHRVATRLAGPREGLLAGALVALGGPVVWAYLYGSDIALFLFLALLLLDRWLAFWCEGRATGFALTGALVALARPEGLPIALALGAASLLRPAASRRERLLPWVPAASGLLLLALLRLVTGYWLGTSVVDKALLPSYGLVQSLDVAAKYGVDVVRGLLLGFYPSEAPVGFSSGQAAFVFPPLGLVFVLLAAIRPPAEARVPLRVWLAVVAVVFALVGPNIFMGIHFNRYLMWAFPGLLALVAVGLGIATRLVAREDAALDRVLFRTFAGLFVALGLLATARFAAVYAEMAASTWLREIPTAEWIRQHLPPGVAIANGATSIEYLTGHRNVNLHGVTSPRFVGTRPVEREAGYFEALRRLPRSQRPPYLLVPRSTLKISELVPLLTDGPPLFQTASLGDDFVLFHTRWEILDGGSRLYDPETLATVEDLEEVDRLNVCDHEDELAHGYRFRSRRADLVLGGSVEIGDYALPTGAVTVADAGRAILGYESFRVHAERGRPLVVVLRSHSDVEVRVLGAHGGLVRRLEMPVARLAVEAQGREVARLDLENAPGWNEHVFEIAADALGEDATDLRLSGQYASFSYWFFQPR
jgi:hypothetical protein